MCWFKTLCSVFIYVGVDWSVGSVLCYQSLWASMVVVYIFSFPQVVHVIDLCVRPYCSRLFVLCHKLYTFSYARPEQARRLLEVIFTRNFKLGNLQPLFRWSDFWENLKSSLGKVCFYLGKVWNFFVKFFDMILWKNFVVGKIWNWWIWVSILKF